MSFVVGLLELLLCSKNFFSFVFGGILSSPSPAALVVEIWSMGGLRDHHSHAQISAGLCLGIFAITLGLLCQAFSWVPGVEAVNGLHRPVLRFNNEGTFKILQVQIELLLLLLLLLLLPNPMPFLYPSFMLLNVCFHLHGFGMMAWENLGGGETNTESGTEQREEKSQKSK